MEIRQEIAKLLAGIKEKRPLVHHITNYVTANDCANIVLAIGASPVMADDPGEVEEMVSLASALVLNMGTLNSLKIQAMFLAGRKANKLGIPVILDPVGVAATGLRNETVVKLMAEVKLTVIRGNISEVKRLAGLKVVPQGVDSLETIQGADEIASNLARRLGCVVAVTGARDVISDGNRLSTAENGHVMLSRVTGTGCMTTSLIGTCCGVSTDYYVSATAGIVTMGLAGEKAYQSLTGQEGAGTFRVKLFDSVSGLSAEDVLERARIEEQ